MMTTNADITIFNAVYDKATRNEKFTPTVIRNVSFYASETVNTNDGVLTDQSAYKIRIPYLGAEIDDRRKYVPEERYNGDSSTWTIRHGDLIALGVYAGNTAILTRAEASEWASSAGIKMISITDYADNTARGCDSTKHWRIGGR